MSLKMEMFSLDLTFYGVVHVIPLAFAEISCY